MTFKAKSGGGITANHVTGNWVTNSIKHLKFSNGLAGWLPAQEENMGTMVTKWFTLAAYT